MPIANHVTIGLKQYVPEKEYWLPEKLTSEERNTKKTHLLCRKEERTKYMTVSLLVVCLLFGSIANGLAQDAKSSLAASFFANSCGGQTPQGQKKLDRPAVVLYNTSGMNVELHMVFDVTGSNLLGEKPEEVVTLSAPSQELNPWTLFSHGSLVVVLELKDSEVTESTVYGGYIYENVKTSDGEQRIVVFQRQGAGEKAFGSDQGKIWRIAGKDQSLIGEQSWQDVIAPDGKRSVLTTRLKGENQKLTVDMGGKIMQVETGGTLTQVGCVAWRKITTPQGKHLGILMTKSMDKDATWGGRYDGKLYQDK